MVLLIYWFLKYIIYFDNWYMKILVRFNVGGGNISIWYILFFNLIGLG